LAGFLLPGSLPVRQLSRVVLAMHENTPPAPISNTRNVIRSSTAETSQKQNPPDGGFCWNSIS
jgi:hypothetical protein